MELRLFFDRALGASFRDLALGEDPASPYLADLLTRFARTENLFPPGVETPRLETVVDMLLETQRVWREDTARFQPEREVVVRRHIGDFALFMTGLFRERVERTASASYYITQGKRAYHFVSEHDRASARAGSVSTHGSFWEARSASSSLSSRFFVMSPPAASTTPTVSLTISEQRRAPPRPPSKSTHAAREPLPSIPESHARVARSGRDSTTGPRPGPAGAATPRWASR